LVNARCLKKIFFHRRRLASRKLECYKWLEIQKRGIEMEVATENHRTKNVMIVDDDNDIRDAISQILEYEGYNVLQASNGQEGIERLRQQDRPSLILLDLMMPVMNGWQFQSELQNQPDLSKIPVIILSADGNIQQKSEGIGVAGYLKKPIQLDTLLDTVKRYCN
jgi:two-component system chemotaxis response regulator CheY